ncbi:MAG TPA: single-stranded DNA-binding protein [Treponemataceae bacterium]|nr:single-stranded DNA-binding protein [Treponemataceae bacterium]
MNSLNSILIEGNVVRDPILKETPRGSTVCSFSIASNRFYKQDDGFEQETSFFEVESWSKLAESCSKNCGKGRGVRVVGRLKQDRWVGSDGKNFSKIKVIADHVEFKPRFKNSLTDSKTETEIELTETDDEGDTSRMVADLCATETNLIF